MVYNILKIKMLVIKWRFLTLMRFKMGSRFELLKVFQGVSKPDTFRKPVGFSSENGLSCVKMIP